MRFLCVCCAFASCFRKDVLDTEADRLFVRSTCSKVSGQAMSSYAKIDVSRCLEMSRVNSSSLSSPFSYSIQLQVTGEYHRIESHAPSTATAATAAMALTSGDWQGRQAFQKQNKEKIYLVWSPHQVIPGFSGCDMGQQREWHMDFPVDHPRKNILDLDIWYKLI